MILKEYSNVLESDENNTEKQIRNSTTFARTDNKGSHTQSEGLRSREWGVCSHALAG